jgi:hypothetical protein
MDAPSDDPFAKLLAFARSEADRTDTMWPVSGFASEVYVDQPYITTYWREVIRLLEALSLAARVSRILHKRCVAPPSRDMTLCLRVETLHELLMQQLRSLEIGCVDDQQQASVVPTRTSDGHAIEEQRTRAPPAPLRGLVLDEDDNDNGIEMEQEGGGTCIIT